MNRVYLYSDTFLNLLSLVIFLNAQNITPSNIKPENYTATLFEETINLKITPSKNLLPKFYQKAPSIFKIMYYVYLSSHPNKELIIYYFYLNFLKYHNKVINMRNISWVNDALKIAKYVSHEAHKLKGFIRFTELEKHVLYAQMEPTNNIITIVSAHFKKRLPNEYWLIHDTKRNIISVYDQKDFYLLDATNLQLNLKTTSHTYEDLWCTFYDTIGIKERKNNRCRLNFMPKKYWKNIIEMRNNHAQSNK